MQHRRPLAVLAARAAIEGANVRGLRTGPYAPPATAHGSREHAAADIGELCVGILRGVLLGEDFSPVRKRLATDFTWSPHLFAVSRDQLLNSAGAVDVVGETLTEVALDVTDIRAIHDRVYVEWRLTARFTSAEFIDDDLRIEPTGRLLEPPASKWCPSAWVHCEPSGTALLRQTGRTGPAGAGPRSDTASAPNKLHTVRAVTSTVRR